MTERSIPEAELEILACLHRLEEATAAELRSAIAGYRPLAHGSVITLLKRLEGRKLVRKRKGPKGKAFLYQPCHEPSSTLGGVLDRLLNRIFAGDSVALVSSLLETSPPDEKELEDLQQLLDRFKRDPKEGA